MLSAYASATLDSALQSSILRPHFLARPFSMSPQRALLCLSLFFQAGLVAQDLPKPPADGLRDDTRAFSESTRTALVKELAECQAQIGYPIWFTAGTFQASGTSTVTQARELRQAWTAGQEGIVMAYDRATDALALSFSPGLWERYPSVEIISLLRRLVLPTSPPGEDLETRLSTRLRLLLSTVKTLEKQHSRMETALPRDHQRLAKGYATALVTGGLVCLLLGSFIRRREVRAHVQSYFPRVQVGQRLGAAHGGGVSVIWEPLGVE